MSDRQLHNLNGDPSDAAMLPSLPSSWCWASLDELIQNFDGRRIPVKSDDRDKRSGPYPYYGASGVIDDIDDFLFDGDYLLIAEDGANLLSRSTPIAFRASGKFWVNNHAHIVQMRGGIPLAYLQSYLNGTNLQFFITGTAQPKLNQVNLNRIPVPVAPIAEQGRIVAKIEELFSDLDAGVAALKRAKANLKRYRAAVLKAAVEGKLTEEWRAKHPAKEPASKLLERILKERRQKWEANQLAKFAAADREPPKNWREKYVEPTPPDTDGLPELPGGWCWASVEQLGNVQLGRQRSPKNRSDKFPTKYIRAANLTETGLDLTDVMDMEFQPNELETYRLRPGDVLLSEASGSPDQVGKPVVWNGEIEDCCFQNTVIRLRPVGMPSEFPLTVFRHYYRSKLFAKVSAGVGINHLSAGKFSALHFPLAPLVEQHCIVADVEEKLSQITAAEQQVAADIIRAARLRQSILKQAFEGKLVPHDPKDEPASVLLERLKATRDGKMDSANGSPRTRPRRRVSNSNSED